MNEQDNSLLLPKGPVPALLRTGATGTVLEIGPGSGIHLRYMDNPKISAVYGAEPAIGLHQELKRSARDAGLADKYHILSCGAESRTLLPALEKEGLLVGTGAGSKAIFDSIVSVRVLCGVSSQQETIEGLYQLLKPGGSFVIYEHVANPWRQRKGSIVGRAVQLLYTSLGWTFFWGGCRLGQKTGDVFAEVGRRHGGWEQADLDTMNPWGAIPYVYGVLVKRK